jgi:hypothetical protein
MAISRMASGSARGLHAHMIGARSSSFEALEVPHGSTAAVAHTPMLFVTRRHRTIDIGYLFIDID